jgi:hypothetical protein
MNERIQELAEQAMELVDPYAVEGEFGPKRLNVEKFAELIVRECARIACATPAPDFDDHVKQQLGHTWDMAAIEAGREIIKHFGV